jgi:hypothetical protein
MTATLARFTRRIAPLVLATGLLLSPPGSTRTLAQEEPAPSEVGPSKGRPLDGYLGTVVLVMLALFLVGKSARR